MPYTESNADTWMTGLYEVEPIEVKYRWDDRDGFRIERKPRDEIDFNKPGEYILLSNDNRIKLPTGRKIVLGTFTKSKAVQQHLFGSPTHIIPDFAYSNNEQRVKRTLLEELCWTLKKCSEQRYYTKRQGTGTIEDISHFRKWLHQIVPRKAVNEALGDHGHFHSIVQAAIGMWWGMTNDPRGLGWIEYLRGTLRQDAAELGDKLIDLLTATPPVRITRSEQGERLIYVDDAGRGDVAYLAANTELSPELIRGKWLYDYLNPVAIKPGDVLREPGVLFGPTGGRLWQAGFDFSSTTIFGDFIHPPRDEDIERAGPVLEPREARLLRKRWEDAEERGKVEEAARPYDNERRVRLMSNLMDQHPIEMCDVYFGTDTLFPAMFSALEDMYGMAERHAAVVAVLDGVMSFDCRVCMGGVRLEANKVYLLSAPFARAFTLFGHKTPTQAMVMGSHLMIPHR